MESLAVASHPLQDLNRQGGSGEPPLPKSIDTPKRREDFSSRRSFLWGQSCVRALLHTGRKGDVGAVYQVDVLGIRVHVKVVVAMLNCQRPPTKV
jgi:hypothetical protein